MSATIFSRHWSRREAVMAVVTPPWPGMRIWPDAANSVMSENRKCFHLPDSLCCLTCSPSSAYYFYCLPRP